MPDPPHPVGPASSALLLGRVVLCLPELPAAAPGPAAQPSPSPVAAARSAGPGPAEPEAPVPTGVTPVLTAAGSGLLCWPGTRWDAVTAPPGPAPRSGRPSEWSAG